MKHFNRAQPARPQPLLLKYFKNKEPPKEAYNYAAEIKLRAERRLGEILKEVPKNEGRAATGPRGTKTEPRKRDQQPPTLAESGLTKKQSSKAQKFAAGLLFCRFAFSTSFCGLII